MSNVICAACHVPVRGPENPTLTDIFSCPECGVGAPYTEVMEEAKAYATKVGQEMLNAKMRDVASKSSIMTFTPGTPDTRQYRFILDPI